MLKTRLFSLYPSKRVYGSKESLLAVSCIAFIGSFVAHTWTQALYTRPRVAWIGQKYAPSAKITTFTGHMIFGSSFDPHKGLVSSKFQPSTMTLNWWTSQPNRVQDHLFTLSYTKGNNRGKANFYSFVFQQVKLVTRLKTRVFFSSSSTKSLWKHRQNACCDFYGVYWTPRCTCMDLSTLHHTYSSLYWANLIAMVQGNYLY